MAVQEELEEALVAVRARDYAEYLRLREEAQRGVHHAHGKTYPVLVGESHTDRMMRTWRRERR